MGQMSEHKFQVQFKLEGKKVKFTLELATKSRGIAILFL